MTLANNTVFKTFCVVLCLAIVLTQLGCGGHTEKQINPEERAEITYNVILRDRPAISTTMPRLTAPVFEQGTPVRLGELSILLPSTLTITKPVARSDSGYIMMQVAELSGNHRKYKVGFYADRDSFWPPYCRMTVLDEPMVVYYIKDIQQFATRFTTDVEFFRTLHNITPTDLKQKSAWTRQEIKGMVMAKDSLFVPAEELDCTKATFMRMRAINTWRTGTISGEAFDEMGNYRGLVFVRPVSGVENLDTAKVFDQIFSQSVFDPITEKMIPRKWTR